MTRPYAGTRGDLERIEARLAARLPQGEGALFEAMREALLASGKRLRPLMTLLAAEDLGGSPSAALDVGCAVEMVHTASLILDDLPCMDDAMMRRGRPTLHQAYGEDVAVLAAVTLLSHAYAVAAEADGIDAAARLDCIRLIAGAVGTEGLAAGQLLDLRGGRAARPAAAIETTNALKTGALFAASAEAGAVIAADETARPLLRAFAQDIGHAFQLLDDLTDLQPSSATGKDSGRDAGKSTLVSLVGVASVETRIERHLDEAHMHLMTVFGARSRLAGLVDEVFSRMPPQANAANA